MLKIRYVTSILGCLLFFSSFLVTCDGYASETEDIKITPVAILMKDDKGRPLAAPQSIYYDKTTAETYVVNSGHAQLIIYDSTFFPLLTIGAGRGIDSPYCITSNSDIFYVCQGATPSKPNRISILNAAFLVEREIPLDNLPDVKDFMPRSIAFATDGKMYVAGHNTRGVVVLNRDGNFLRFLIPKDKVWNEKNTATDTDSDQPQTTSSSTTEPVSIIDVTIDSAGRIYLLSEETSKVYVYDKDEKFLFSFGEKGGSSTKMSRPRGIAVDEEGNRIFVVDYMRHTILVYNMSGQYLFEFGGNGWGPGWFNYPTRVAVDKKGNVIIADLFNNRVQVLSVVATENAMAGNEKKEMKPNFLPVRSSKN